MGTHLFDTLFKVASKLESGGFPMGEDFLFTREGGEKNTPKEYASPNLHDVIDGSRAIPLSTVV